MTSRPKTYGEHIREQMAGEARSFTSPTAAAGDSIASRYLASSTKIEMESASPIVAQVRTGTEEEALATIVRDRRGSAVDLALSMGVSGVGYALGKVGDQLAPHPAITAIPAVASIAAGFFLKVPYAARSGLANFGLSMLMGAKSNKKET